MNELDDLDVQAKDVLKQGPCPFDQYDEKSKSFKVGGGDKMWRNHCMEKFAWVK